MTRLLSFLLSATLLIGAGPEVPRRAPEFAIQTAPEKYLWLHDYAGKPVVLAFILTTCPHCQFTTGLLNKVKKDYEAKGVLFIESAIEPMSSLHIPDFQKAMGTTYPVGYNEQGYVAKFLGYDEKAPLMMPQVVFIDAQGMIRAQFAGDDPKLERGIQEATLRAALDEAIKEGQAAVRLPARVKKPQ